MDRKTRKGILRAEGEIYKRTSISSTRLRQKKMRMKFNVSEYTTGGIPSMECEDRWWRLVAFLSKSLNDTERSYEIHNKEMLAVIRGLED